MILIHIFMPENFLTNQFFMEVAEKEVASVGKAQPIKFNIGALNDEQQGAGEGGGDGGAPQKTAEEIESERLAAEEAEKLAGQGKPLTDEEVKAEYEKRFPKTTEPSEEEKQKAAAAHEKRMLDLYVSKGGKVDDYVAMKQLKDADVVEVSKTVLHKELLAAGLDEDEAKAATKQIMLEQDLENIVQGESEADDDFAKRKAKIEKQITAGAKALANFGTPVINKAKGIFEGLEMELKAKDAEDAEEVELSKSIDAHIKALPREMTIELGEVNNKPAEPFKLKFDDATLEEVATTLKDTKQRDALFYDEKGNFNYTFMADILAKAKSFDKAVKDSLIEGQNRQVEIFKKQFPDRSAYGIGVGGAPDKTGIDKTVAVKAGQPQRIKPQMA